MVQNGEDVYTRNENYEIDKEEKPFALSKDFTESLLTAFDSCSTNINPIKAQCETSSTIWNGRSLCKYDIIFSEDFDDISTADIEDHWKYDISLRVNGDGDEEFVMFQKSTRTTFIRNGNLHILPRIRDGEIRSGTIVLNGCTSTNEEDECAIKADAARKFLPPITAAQLSTMDSYHFKYGRVEIRAKLPIGDWIFPRLMLRPVYGNGPYIKIAFALGNTKLINGTDYAQERIGGNVLSGGLIHWISKEKIDGVSVKEAVINVRRHISREHYGNDFHTYSLTWTSSNLVFQVDDITYGIINESLNSEYYIVLGVSAGGHYEFPDNSKTGRHRKPKPWTNLSHKAILNFWYDRNNWEQTWEGDEALQVDYVRVFAI